MLHGYNFYVPEILISYDSGNLTNWLNDYNSTNNQAIVNALDSQTTAINQQTNTLQATQDYISDDSISSSNMSVDTSSVSITDNTGIDNHFTDFLGNLETKIKNYDTSEVSVVTIPLPYNMPSLTLRSDLISSHLPSGGLRSIINIYWTFLFGGYIVSFVYRMIKWLSSGKIFEDKGVSGFISWLDQENEIIKGYMM